jgi:ferric-dicitrate binding protein FerR (iron transport regulator)
MSSKTQLLSAYFDGDLLPEEYQQLRAWLLADPQRISDFVVDSFVHAQLVELLGPEQMRADRLVAANTWPKATRRSPVLRATGRALAVAASLLFVVALTYFTLFRPEVVATVSGTRDVQWVLGAQKRTVGALLQSGDELALDRGTLHLTFARGGQIALHGPARFRIASDMSGRLIRGRLSAFVPEHAVGFTIHSGRLNVVDLGTEFSLELAADQSCEIQVFDGLVELQFGEPPDEMVGGGKLHLSQGRAVRFDASTGNVNPIDYDQTKRLPASVWSR